MTESVPPQDDAGTESLEQQIEHLQQVLRALTAGGVDAVILGGADEEQQVYTLTSADRPYRVIVENMGEGSATVSQAGVILFANRQLGRLVGRDHGGLVGRDVAELMPPEHAERVGRLLRAGLDETTRDEILLSPAEGSGADPVTVQVAVTGFDLDGDVIFCLVFTDLTLQKQMEERMAAQAALQEQQRVAREVHDTIVQGLVAAETALDLGDPERARALVSRTSQQARTWVGQLVGGHVAAGSALRSTAAGTEGEAPQ